VHSWFIIISLFFNNFYQINAIPISTKTIWVTQEEARNRLPGARIDDNCPNFQTPKGNESELVVSPKALPRDFFGERDQRNAKFHFQRFL
jgi:hypothetical protein